MKTNEKICLKCRLEYYAKYCKSSSNDDKISLPKRIKIIAAAHEDCCPLVLQNDKCGFMENVRRWESHEVAEDCPYLLELTVLNENE